MDINKLTNLLKNKNNQLFFVILIIGVVLIFLSGTTGTKEETKTEKSLSEQARLESILSDIKGVGDVSVMITYYEPDKENNNEINKAKGAVVTAKGCWDPSIKTAITEAVCAALDLPAHKVCVYVKK